MEMKKINSGKLRAIGYDARASILQAKTTGIANLPALCYILSRLTRI